MDVKNDAAPQKSKVSRSETLDTKEIWYHIQQLETQSKKIRREKNYFVKDPTHPSLEIPAYALDERNNAHQLYNRLRLKYHLLLVDIHTYKVLEASLPSYKRKVFYKNLGLAIIKQLSKELSEKEG